MTTGGCRDHATHIEECMGCNGGRWDPKAADELIEAGYAVGITAAALRVAKAEIARLRENERAGADRVRSVVREKTLIVLEDQSATVVQGGGVLMCGTPSRRKALEFCADVIADRVASHITDAPQRDGCQFCLGAKGGTPGNENVIGGVVVCDYCTSLLMDMDKARVASQLGSAGLSTEERDQLSSLRREAIADDYPAAVAWLDRLLGGGGT